MRTVTMMLVVTFLLVCGLAVAAQQEGQPGSPTAPAVEGAPTDSSAEAAPGDSTDTEDAEEEEEDRGNGGGNVDQNPNLNPQPQIVRERVIERRTQVVREIAAASRAGDQATVKRLTIELGKLNERLALVEANPLGGTEGQRRLWQDVLLPAGIKSESYLREHYGLVPVSAPETEQDTMPARPAKGGAPMPLALQIVLGCIAVGAAVMAIIALASRGGNAVDVIDSLLADDRASGERRVVSGRVGNARFKQTTEPANATPVIPPAPAAAPAQPAFPQAAPGQAYVPVQFAPVNVALAPVAPQAPTPAPQPAPAPQGQAQPLNVFFNVGGGQPPAPAQGNPPAQGAQPRQRQPRQQPAQRQQGGAQPPAPGAGAPPAQGGGQPPAGNP